MAAHPYGSLPPEAFWKRGVAEVDATMIDPVGRSKFSLSRTDKIATSGSCFAQHIARHLQRSGFNYLVTETAHPLIPSYIAEPFGYGLFTARYANIYTSRQMLQTLQRAYGRFQPDDDIWVGADGRIFDPFRPRIQPDGFSSVQEFYADRAQHFAAIREAVETLDCLVFTLGLTECWMSRSDGAVYPVCPGVSGGEFDADKHIFHNLTVSEVLSDLGDIVGFIEERNRSARFILTVSPVPLVATASGEHVLTATTMSKSVLRAAAGEFAASRPHVAYFPSYEIITGQHARGDYFRDNLRDVTEAGVSHVMRLFLMHYGNIDFATDPRHAVPNEASRPNIFEMGKIVCEEEALQSFAKHNE